MSEIFIDWDGRSVPRALLQLAPGRYRLEPVGDNSGETESATHNYSEAAQGATFAGAGDADPSALPLAEESELHRQALIEALAYTAGILSPEDYDEADDTP